MCKCRTYTVVAGYNLRYAASTNCGCLGKVKLRSAITKHGEGSYAKGRSREYRAWLNMWNRCTNAQRDDYRYYGGRGITVCERWKEYPAFIADVGRSPGRGYSLDRYPDKNGPYAPDNCRWATWQQQRANQRPHQPRQKRPRALLCKRGHVLDRLSPSGRQRCSTCCRERQRRIMKALHPSWYGGAIL